MSTEPSGTARKFDLEKTLRLLRRLAKESNSSEDRTAIDSAASGLCFLDSLDKLYDFQDYLDALDKEAGPESSFEHSFSTMAEAMAWLHSQPEPRYGTRVEVGGSPHVVVNQRSVTWILIPEPPIPPMEPERKP